MMNRIWSIDGKETSGDNGAVVKWDNEKFFHIELGENIFFGECPNSFRRVKQYLTPLLLVKTAHSSFAACSTVLSNDSHDAGGMIIVMGAVITEAP